MKSPMTHKMSQDSERRTSSTELPFDGNDTLARQERASWWGQYDGCLQGTAVARNNTFPFVTGPNALWLLVTVTL